MPDLKPLFQLFSEAGRTPPNIPQEAHLVAYGHQIASQKSAPGVSIRAWTDDEGIIAELVISQNIRERLAAPP